MEDTITIECRKEDVIHIVNSIGLVLKSESNKIFVLVAFGLIESQMTHTFLPICSRASLHTEFHLGLISVCIPWEAQVKVDNVNSGFLPNLPKST